MDHSELVNPSDAEIIQLRIERLRDQAEEFERRQKKILSWDFEYQAIWEEHKWRREHRKEGRGAGGPE
ncbi:hypothetical protein [Deinococcus alpinitundrae]|uniref:hypothetical protein n=1 Tax=Deinococcus alpinitundrae TaxID=468913 RepID=UPI00137B261A|nr:hypothetical protein [Deinococcus alpinitundrae]